MGLFGFQGSHNGFLATEGDGFQGLAIEGVEGVGGGVWKSIGTTKTPWHNASLSEHGLGGVAWSAGRTVHWDGELGGGRLSWVIRGLSRFIFRGLSRFIPVYSSRTENCINNCKN